PQAHRPVHVGALERKRLPLFAYGRACEALHDHALLCLMHRSVNVALFVVAIERAFVEDYISARSQLLYQ
ncbi:MAG TPA: hypothetical protein VFT23_16270, partial [Burkholderiales bacterium]|nr:hypothetical protein [Burkholderiales bacterium]